MEERNVQEDGYVVFPVILKFIAILCVIVGIVCAVNFGTEFNGFWRERNAVTTFLYAAGGIINGVLWWSLSYIVEACQRYINNNENNPK